MAINSLKISSYVGAVLKNISHFCYNRFNPAVLEKSQNMLFTTRNNGLYLHVFIKKGMDDSEKTVYNNTNKLKDMT